MNVEVILNCIYARIYGKLLNVFTLESISNANVHTWVYRQSIYYLLCSYLCLFIYCIYTWVYRQSLYTWVCSEIYLILYFFSQSSLSYNENTFHRILWKGNDDNILVKLYKTNMLSSFSKMLSLSLTIVLFHWATTGSCKGAVERASNCLTEN